MTIDAVDALRADHASLAALTTELTPSEGSAPSACQGWSVRDVVAHMTLPAGRRPHVASAARSIRELGAHAGSMGRGDATARHAGRPGRLPQAGRAGNRRPRRAAGVRRSHKLGDLGTNPHLVANALAFDHYTHIRADVLAPRGPLRPAVPSAGAGHLGGDGLDGGRVPADERRRARLARRAARPAPHGTWRALGRRRPRRLRPGRRLVVDRGLRAVGDEARGLATVDVRIAGDETTAERFCDTIRVF
jgi:hypothetical protein